MMLLQQHNGYGNGAEGFWVLLSLNEFNLWYLLSEIASELWKGLA